MDFNLNVLESIFAFLGGGIVSSFLNYIINLKSNKREELSAVVETWQKDNDRLRFENKSLQKELLELRKEFSDLKAKVLLLENAHIDIPLPMWLKDTRGTILSVNKEYESKFLAPRNCSITSFVGQNDNYVWKDEKLFLQLKSNDHTAMYNGIWNGVERYPTIDGKIEDWLVVRYPKKIGNTIVGIAGIAMPVSGMKML